tara:strand:- start:2208 stop:2348 length:141 start_codon:yes stop_codon:yes gene_type:complete
MPQIQFVRIDELSQKEVFPCEEQVSGGERYDREGMGGFGSERFVVA